jgi:flagellar hook assembly protein FlgD
LRKAAVALALLLLASVGVAVPAGAAAAEPKVVIIVGATEGTTDAYRRDADETYAAALLYTSNVVKVYSPNATWARVKAAVTGASVVVYLGHGNGWPSPYTYDPNYTTKDGFGLNKVEGAGDNNRVYYGEPYISTLALSGAVVILNHLCYASGNSESGAADPSVPVARQRVDNYASAFLRAGAAAVIADAHYGLDGYLRDLFTTSQPIESLWADQASARGNLVSFPSSRTPGATAYMDPNTPTSGFYRSLVVRTAGTVVSFGSGGGSGTGGGTAPPPPVADTTPPQLRAVDPGPETISTVSPNGDGSHETVTLSVTSSEPGSLVAAVRDPFGSIARSWAVPTSSGSTAVTWDGRDAAGAPVVDGRYVLSVTPTDAAGNIGAGQERIVDVTAALGSVTSSSTTTFFPVGTARSLRATDLSFTLSRQMTVTWTLRNADGAVVETHLEAATLPPGTQTWTFDGRRSDGRTLAPGRYTSVVEATDGTILASESVSFVADAFDVKPSDTTPARGQRITVTLTTAGPLAANPRVSVYQPGRAAWSVPTVRLSSTSYRATVTLKTGHTGTVTFKASGRDAGGTLQQTSRSYRLH